MTDKDQLERLKWQVTQETGLRAQMTERMETKPGAAMAGKECGCSHSCSELLWLVALIALFGSCTDCFHSARNAVRTQVKQECLR